MRYAVAQSFQLALDGSQPVRQMKAREHRGTGGIEIGRAARNRGHQLVHFERQLFDVAGVFGCSDGVSLVKDSNPDRSFVGVRGIHTGIAQLAVSRSSWLSSFSMRVLTCFRSPRIVFNSSSSVCTRR